MEEKTIDKLMGEGFRFSKGLGQNFITDRNLLAAIVSDADVTGDDTVLEVGAGAGTLTEQIALKAKKVVSVEIDESLRPHLEQKFASVHNVQLVFGDILKISQEDIKRLTDGKPFKVIANIPYYITSPIIFYFLDGGFDLTSLTLMVQKEVAERIISRGGEDYGAISVNIQSRAKVEILRAVSKKLFTPPPKIDSAVLKIQTAYRDEVMDYSQLHALVKAAFAMRRKTLLNCLGSAGINKQDVERALLKLGLPATVRGEALSVEQFISLSNVLVEGGANFAQAKPQKNKRTDQ